MNATRKESLNDVVQTNGSIHQEQNITGKTAENKATKVCTITELQGVTVGITPKKTGATAPWEGN